MRVVVPAYILSELKAGFAIGAVLYLPFLLIDIVEDMAAIEARPELGAEEKERLKEGAAGGCQSQGE